MHNSAGAKERPNLQSRAERFLLAVAVALLPVYVFKSGSVQPAHFVLLLFALVTLMHKRIPGTYWSISILILALYSLLVESIYTSLGYSSEGLINGAYFFYNFIISCAIYQHCRRLGVSALSPAILVSCTIAILSVLHSGVDLQEWGPNGRPTGTFNNPNQLGYFSVCLLSLAYLVHRERTILPVLVLAMFASSLFLAIASLSKAAMLANFAVIFLALKPTSARKYIVFWALGTLIAGTLIFSEYEHGRFDSYIFMQRLENMASENDSSLEARGYYALESGTFSQVIFGLGSEEVRRIVGHEVHSTLGSVLMGYGIVGLLLFSVTLCVWIWRLWKSYDLIGMACLAGPAMLYGITHNGSRFAMFWLLFAASLGAADRRSRLARQRVGGQLHAEPVEPLGAG